MKKTLLLLAIMMAMCAAAMAGNNPVVATRNSSEAAAAATLPIFSDETITEAPAGTVMSNQIRKGYSYFYSGGTVLGGYNDSFAGEYVLGNDGNIYIKNACASLVTNTYLKLEKVEGAEDQYVAHGAQLIWVDYSGDTPYLAFAVRLVFHEYGASSYGYVLEEDANGKAVTDVFFTYKDGVLKQTCQETVEMNGVTYPKEMLAITNSTGGWIGYGDACIEFESNTQDVVSLPEGAEVKEMSFSFNDFSSKRGVYLPEARLNKCAEVGDEYYIACPGNTERWIKGSIDREAGTVTFLKQYVGVNSASGVHEWFLPASHNLWFDLIDEEENFGYWSREYNIIDKYVCKYENGSLVSDESLKQAFAFSIHQDIVEANGIYCDVVIQPYEEKSVAPMAPVLINFEENNGLWGEFQFSLPPMDDDKVYINTDNLYYSLYFDSEEPFVISADDYWKFPTPGATQVPWGLDDDSDFMVKNTVRLVIFYQEFKYAGVKSIHKVNGEEVCSEIVWYNHDPNGLTRVEAPVIVAEGKRIENGRLVICKNGFKYDAAGSMLK